MMIKARHILYIAIALLTTSCSEEQDALRSGELTAAQRELIGQAVNFSASHADPFATRATQRHDGSFNEEDVMYIYRQYVGADGTTFDPATRAWRVYWLTTRYAAGTTFALETDWKPKAGATGHNPQTADYPADKQGDFIQTEADSLTWENGETVRFRAWSRSNVAGAIANSRTSKGNYYPDYCVSDWVTVSGPTLDVPLTLKHQGCRIGITPKAGNELQRAEICTDWQDYKWPDNAQERQYDESAPEHGKSDQEAKEQAESVQRVYNRMCMPAGVDVNTSLLTTMTQSMYNTTTDFSDLSQKTAADGIVTFGSKSETEISTSVQRPLFCSNDGRLYMVTIPYDMSGAATQGEALVLPSFTRIKIWLYDVNNGDRAATSNEESNYHILTLADITDGDGNPLFPDGMELAPGKSYLFTVGYHYDNYEITPADNFSWDQQDAVTGAAIDEAKAQPTSATPYQWWKDAIKEAIPTATNGKTDYAPEFHIKNEAEFLEFINLVNGTAAEKTDGLTQLLDPTKTFTAEKPATKGDYRWYRSTDVENGKLKGSVAAKDSVTHETAIAEGYIFYEHYYPRNADQAAYSIEDYLRGPYSFYNDNLREHWTVYLDRDLDLCDWKLAPIGNELAALGTSGSHPFRGVFDGQLHTLTNVYIDGGYMFKHCFGAAIRNLKIETTHDFMLVHTAENATTNGYGAYIVGISINAPASGCPIATKLTGSSYVVGCIYQGRAGGAMVGEANNLTMYANMMAGTGLPHNTGALLGKYSQGSSAFFTPQTGTKLSWGRFMANYYLMDRYDGEILHAVGTIADKYRPQEYIRGALAWVLKAKNDNLVSGEVPFSSLSALMQKGYYGLAPWKAMNYALYQYNLVGAQVSEPHNCKAHYVNNSTGYANTFPELVPGEPNSDQDLTGYKGKYDSLNILELFN